MKDTKILVNAVKDVAESMYGYLEELNDLLHELINDPNLDASNRRALVESFLQLNEPELLDEIIARLGCIK